MYNEADRIPGFIAAAKSISCNIVVVVQESSDNSHGLLNDLGVTVINDICHGHPEPSYHLFLEYISTPWAAIVDADESIEADLSALQSLLCSSPSHALSLQRQTKITPCDYLATDAIQLEDDFHLRIFRPCEVLLPSTIHTRIAIEDGSQPEQVPASVAILKHEKTIFEQIKDDLNYMKVMNGQWISRCQLELNNGLLASVEAFNGPVANNFHTSIWTEDSSTVTEGVEICRINTSILKQQEVHSPRVGSINLEGLDRDPFVVAKFPIFSLKNYTHSSFDELFSRYALANHWHLFVEPGSIALDIGGHVGDTSLVLASLVGASGACLAFEPNPGLIGPLRKTAMLNSGNLDIYPVCAAVSDSHLGVSTFADHGNDNINGGIDLTLADATSNWTKSLFSNIPNQVRYDVPTVMLDPFLADFLSRHPPLQAKSISFVKIDVEGFESYILESNSDFFALHQPVLFVEWFQYHGQEDTKRLFDLIIGLGYSPLDPESLSSVSSDSDWIPDILCIPSRLGSWSKYLPAFGSVPEYAQIRSRIDRIKQIISHQDTSGIDS